MKETFTRFCEESWNVSHLSFVNTIDKWKKFPSFASAYLIYQKFFQDGFFYFKKILFINLQLIIIQNIDAYVKLKLPSKIVKKVKKEFEGDDLADEEIVSEKVTNLILSFLILFF